MSPAAAADDRLALVALRGAVAAVLHEVEADRTSARRILLRLLGPGPPDDGRDAGDQEPTRPTRSPTAAPPARRERRKRRPRGRPPGRKPERPGKPTGELAVMVARLEEHHGGPSAAAEAAGVPRAVWSGWRNGRTTPRAAGLDKIRLAVRAMSHDEDEADPLDVAGVAGVDGGDEATPADTAEPEQVALVRQLVARRGSVESAGLVYGFGDSALRRWLAGGQCSPSTLARLREAAREATRAAPLHGAARDPLDPDPADLG